MRAMLLDLLFEVAGRVRSNSFNTIKLVVATNRIARGSMYFSSG